MKNIDKVINEVTGTIKHTDAVVEAVVILPEETRHRNAEWKDVYTCTMATVIFLINFIVCIIFCGVIQNKVDAIEHFLVSYRNQVCHIFYLFSLINQETSTCFMRMTLFHLIFYL